MKNIALICNPTAEARTKALPIADAIAIYLQGKGISFSFYSTEWPISWEGITEVWVVGGDGTLNHFINRYPHLSLPLVLFKGGSGNDFHWMLYGDIKVEAQIEQVLKGSVKEVDAGLCNGQWFLNGVGIGFDGAIVRDLMGKNKVAGKASYLLSILKNIVRYTEKQCSVKTANGVVEENSFMISVANGKRYGGGFMVAPNANVNDGLLDICVIGKIHALRRLKYLPVIEKGEHIGLPFIHYQQANEVMITCNEPLDAHVDGEYLASSIFDIKLAAKKIAFVV